MSKRLYSKQGSMGELALGRGEGGSERIREAWGEGGWS